VSYESWSRSLDLLRQRLDSPAAAVNAVVLVRAMTRWQRVLDVRASSEELVFSRPGDLDGRDVGVGWRAGMSAVRRWHRGQVVEELRCPAATVDAMLDGLLERLVDPLQVCRWCGLTVAGSADLFVVFERMHYSCFHFLFEHGSVDRDQECDADGCPSAGIHPAHVPEQPRDSLVEELIDDLMASSLGQDAINVMIRRAGPGRIDAIFDQHAYLITVRTRTRP
jgi:hypothetical protein